MKSNEVIPIRLHPHADFSRTAKTSYGYWHVTIEMGTYWFVAPTHINPCVECWNEGRNSSNDMPKTTCTRRFWSSPAPGYLHWIPNTTRRSIETTTFYMPLQVKAVSPLLPNVQWLNGHNVLGKSRNVRGGNLELWPTGVPRQNFTPFWPHRYQPRCD